MATSHPTAAASRSWYSAKPDRFARLAGTVCLYPDIVCVCQFPSFPCWAYRLTLFGVKICHCHLATWETPDAVPERDSSQTVHSGIHQCTSVSTMVTGQIWKPSLMRWWWKQSIHHWTTYSLTYSQGLPSQWNNPRCWSWHPPTITSSIVKHREASRSIVKYLTVFGAMPQVQDYPGIAHHPLR